MLPARDVQAAINAARSQLPANLPEQSQLPQGESGGRAHPDSGADLRHASTLPQMYDAADSILAQKLSQVKASARCSSAAAPPAVRVEVNPDAAEQARHRARQVRTALSAANANRPKGAICRCDAHDWTINANDQIFSADEYQPLIVAYHNGAAVRLGRCRRRAGFGRGHSQRRAWPTASPRS